jgi:hypothetical protein
VTLILRLKKNLDHGIAHSTSPYRAPLARATPQATIGPGRAKRMRHDASLVIVALRHFPRFNTQHARYPN